jgi:hypothetical protein
LYLPGTLPRAGLGDAAQIVGQASSVGAPVVIGALSAHAAATAAATGSSALILGMAPALAVPIIGAAIAGVTLLAITLLRSGCGQTCVVTSQWANQAEAALQENIRAYFSNSTRTRSMQNAALANFDVLWAKLSELCGQPGLGQAGVNCIADRQRGACKWHQTADSPLLGYPGQPQPGACWNWFSGYRDPIANDPAVIEDATLAAQTASAELSRVVESAGGYTNLLVLAAGVGLVAWGISQS